MKKMEKIMRFFRRLIRRKKLTLTFQVTAPNGAVEHFSGDQLQKLCATILHYFRYWSMEEIKVIIHPSIESDYFNIQDYREYRIPSKQLLAWANEFARTHYGSLQRFLKLYPPNKFGPAFEFNPVFKDYPELSLVPEDKPSFLETIAATAMA